MSPSCNLRHRAVSLRCVLAVVLLAAAGMSVAAPYTGERFTYRQPDGETFSVRLWGDEFFAYQETDDGFLVVRDPKKGFFCYAKVTPGGGDIVSTGVRVGRAKPPGLRRKGRLAPGAAFAKSRRNRDKLGFDDSGRMLPLPGEQVTPAPSVESGDPGFVTLATTSPTTGTRVGLVLLASFPDRQGDISIPRSEVDAYCNDLDYTANGNATSVRGYYHIQSNGKLDLKAVVTAYFVAAHDRDYYTDPNISYGSRARELIIEGLEALQSEGFDFTRCDANNDGYLDGLNCFYAGSRVNGWSEGLWPHASSLNWSGFTANGLDNTYTRYQITDMGSALTIGTFCHENGHMMCRFPDFYSYDGNAANIGRYSLMHSNGSTHPPNVDPYLKCYAEWADIVDLDSASHQRCAVQRDRNYFYRYMNPGNSQEYFLFEVRDNTGYEGPYGGATGSYNPTEGLVVFHGLESGNNTHSSIYTALNPTNTYDTPYRLLVVEADPASITPWYDDPSPDTADGLKESGVNTLSDFTTPELKFWDLTLDNGRTITSDCVIHSVSADGPTMSFIIGAGALTNPGEIGLTATAFEPRTPATTDADSQEFAIFNVGTGSVSYTVSADQTWLSVSPSAGTVTDEADALTITYTTASRSVGTHIATITITSPEASNSPQRIPVTLTVYGEPPEINSAAGVSDLGATSAVLNGELLTLGTATPTVWCYWNAGSDPGETTTGWDFSRSFGTATVSAPYSNDTSVTAPLTSGTTYYYRYMAVNTYGTTWSEPVSFTTLSPPAVDNSAGASPISTTSARLSATLTAGSMATAWICWGDTDAGTSAVNAWDHAIEVGSVWQDVPFTADALGLETNMTYWYRGFVSNSVGTAWTAAPESFSGTPTSGNGVPGLWFGEVTGNIDTTTPNPNSEILTDVGSKTEDAIAGDTTEIYTGYIYDGDGHISFTESIDDKTRIWVAGNLKLSDDVWNNRVSTSDLNLSPGWNAIEIRISNGTGGSGPFETPGIGYDPTGGTTWQTLVDPGDGSFLRVDGITTLGNLAPTGITETTAWFNALLDSTSTDYDLYVHYGTQDGGTNEASWATSEYVGSWTNVLTQPSYAASGLAAGQTNYYAFRAVNGGTSIWASPSWRFISPGAYVPPTPPRVVSQSPAHDAAQPLGINEMTLTFNRSIDVATFTTADDVTAFTGAGGADLRSTITGHSWANGNTELTLTFAALNDNGSCRLVVGPQILDLTGNPMDQDQDGSAGEAIEDSYAANIWVSSGGAGLTIWSDLLGTDDTPDSWTLGSGWETGAPNEDGVTGPGSAVDGTVILAQNLSGPYESGSSTSAETPDIDGTAFSAITLDFQEWKGLNKNDWMYIEVGVGGNWTEVYSIKGPNGGTNDGAWGPHSIDISANADGQLFRVRWRLVDSVGSPTETGWQLDAIRVTGDGGTASPPPPVVLSHTPTGTVGQAVSSIYLEFSQPMDTSSFNAGSDIASFTGPSGTIAVTGSAWVSSTVLRIDFAEQSLTGTYTLVLNPSVLDEWSQPLDQDGDGTPNEPGDDPYSAVFAINTDYLIDAPSGLTATAAAYGEVDLDWTDNSGNESGFRIERSLSSGSGFAAVGATPANTTTYTDTTVTGGETYYYLVYATNAVASSDPSAEASVATLKLPATLALSNLQQTYDGTARSVSATTEPAGLTVDVTYGGNAAAPTNAGSYAVVATIDDANYEGSTNGTLTVQQATPTVNTWPTAATIVLGQTLADATLSGGSASVAGTFTYDSPSTAPGLGVTPAAVTFAPTDATNYETVGGTVNVTVDPPAPPEPTSLDATASPGQVALSWTAAQYATSYDVKRSTSPGGFFATIDSTTETSYTDLSAEGGTTYYYVISAVNGTGTSPDSAEAIAVVLHVIPFTEDFESRTLSDLDGQNGWRATNTVVETEIAVTNQTGSIATESGYAEQSFFGRETNVWTDMRVQPVFCPDEPNMDPEATVGLYFNTNGNPVAYNGLVPVTLSNATVTAGTWTRVTINSDYASRTWALYIDSVLVESDLGFYSGGATNFTQFEVRGAGNDNALFDDILIDIESPLAPPPNALPQVAITSPSTGSFVMPGTNLTITAQSSDPDGTVAQVWFYADGTNLIDTSTVVPFSTVEWSNVPMGYEYLLSAVAVDNDGGAVTSLTVTVVVDGDRDGIPDFWENRYGLSTTGTNAPPDRDADGHTDLEEYIAGTIPTNSASVFRIVAMGVTNTTDQSIGFDTVTNRMYTVQWRMSLPQGAWTNLITDIVGTGARLSVEDSAGAPQRFYRVLVRQE